MIKNKGGISVGDQTAVNTWASKCSIYSRTGDISTFGLISAGGNISSGGNITATGNITSTGYLAITATTGRPVTPSATGCYLGCDRNYWAALELCGVNAAYVNFTTAGTYEGSVCVFV
ncbi:MAG: hypothetical protein ACKPKO_25305 [Candidatus Fonsibacter sp.]